MHYSVTTLKLHTLVKDDDSLLVLLLLLIPSLTTQPWLEARLRETGSDENCLGVCRLIWPEFTCVPWSLQYWRSSVPLGWTLLLLHWHHLGHSTQI